MRSCIQVGLNHRGAIKQGKVKQVILKYLQSGDVHIPLSGVPSSSIYGDTFLKEQPY